MELLVVVSLIAILAFFAVPSIQQFLLMNKANTQLNQIVRSLNFARNLAIIENKTVIVCPITELNSHECGKDWKKGINVYLQITATNKSLVKSVASFNEANLSWNRKANIIIFSENGLLHSQNGSFIYQLAKNKNYIRQIIVSSTGRVRVSH